jgi:hypothetical protein
LATSKNPKQRHSREGGNLIFAAGSAVYETWIPAFAGMTRSLEASHTQTPAFTGTLKAYGWKSPIYGHLEASWLKMPANIRVSVRPYLKNRGKLN